MPLYVFITDDINKVQCTNRWSKVDKTTSSYHLGCHMLCHTLPSKYHSNIYTPEIFQSKADGIELVFCDSKADTSRKNEREQ